MGQVLQKIELLQKCRSIRLLWDRNDESNRIQKGTMSTVSNVQKRFRNKNKKKQTYQNILKIKTVVRLCLVLKKSASNSGGRTEDVEHINK